MEFVELTEKEFAGAEFSCRSFLQSGEMYWRYRDMGREVYLVGVKQSGEIIAAGMMMAQAWRMGKKIFRVPGGWLMDYDADAGEVREILRFVTREAKQFCQGRGGIALEISPNVISQPRDMFNQVVEGVDHLAVRRDLEALGYKYLGEYGQAKWIFVLDLEGKKAEEMLMGFRTTSRQLICKAERQGIRVRELGVDELDILKEIASEAGERHGFQDPEMEYYRSMKKAFGDKVKFVVAEAPKGLVQGEVVQNDGGAKAKAAQGNDATEAVRGDGGAKAVQGEYVPLAAAMFVNDGREMVYLYSGSLRKYQKYNGAYAIQWQMIREAMETGCKQYNFYGVKPVEGNGVYQFKQGFRGVVVELLGTFVLPIGALGKAYVAKIKPREYGEVH